MLVLASTGNCPTLSTGKVDNLFVYTKEWVHQDYAFL